MAEPMKRLPKLPVERALKVISGRWKPVILYHVFSGPKRLSELKRMMPEITQKVLIQQLRRDGGTRPRAPGDLCRGACAGGIYGNRTRSRLEPILFALCQWGQNHAEAQGELDELTDCIVRPRHPEAIAA